MVGAACSRPSPPGSCFRAHQNACTQYEPAEAAAGKRLCSGFQWNDGDHTCPPSPLGRCTKKPANELLYAGPPNNYTTASAQTYCEGAGGTFTPAATAPGTSP